MSEIQSTKENRLIETTNNDTDAKDSTENRDSSFLQRIKKCCDGENDRPANIIDLAKRVNIAHNSIYKWDSQKPTYDKVFEVAQVLDTTVEYLVTGKVKE